MGVMGVLEQCPPFLLKNIHGGWILRDSSGAK